MKIDHKLVYMFQVQLLLNQRHHDGLSYIVEVVLNHGWALYYIPISIYCCRYNDNEVKYEFIFASKNDETVKGGSRHEYSTTMEISIAL